MQKAIIPFIIFILLFFGVGFISGGAVHLGEGVNVWDISLVVVGILLFVTGSYIQEVIFNKKNLIAEGIIPFLVYSLVLSIGVGMASGGIQHFVDTPQYSMFLIPIGLIIGLFAFIFKQNIQLASQQWVKLIVSSMIMATLLGIGLFVTSNEIIKKPLGHHGIDKLNVQENHIDTNINTDTHDTNEEHPHK